MQERVSLHKPNRSQKKEHLILENEIHEINAMALSREISAPLGSFNKQTKIEKTGSNKSLNYPAFRKSSQASEEQSQRSEFNRIDSFQT
jgi:hypothetical protein